MVQSLHIKVIPGINLEVLLLWKDLTTLLQEHTNAK